MLKSEREATLGGLCARVFACERSWPKLFQAALTALRSRRSGGWLFCLCCIGCIVSNGQLSVVLADEPVPVAEVRDVILMLDNGPLHVRVHVSVGKVSPTEARHAMIERVMKRLDTNGDGKLSREESQRSPLFREKQRPRAEEFVKSLGADMTVSARDVARQIERLGGETVIYRRSGTDAASDDQVFKSLDANNDGVISEAEMFDAVDKLLAKDLDDDECVTLDEFSPLPDPMIVGQVAPATQPAPAGPPPEEIIRDTQQTLLPQQLIKKYDKDKNRKLSPEELNWPKERIAVCDTDNDGQLSLKELSGLKNMPVDIELAADVIRTTGEPMLRVIGSAGNLVDGDRVPDLARVVLPTAVVTFSTREVDPFETSMAIALRTFNELDVDNNGYLDKDESMVRERLRRVLFDQIDADGDGKIFGEEMKDYIRTLGEPVATTCQITAFDDGAGFFSTLDTNGDQRLSMREMRYADKTLAKMEQDGKPGLSAKEPARRFRVEFARGVFNPFGNPDRVANARMPQTAVATVKPRPVGPIWFQRWDRNNDGDITWREFLGPRDAFEQIDADRDDLIDPKEADRALELMKSRVTTPASVQSATFQIRDQIGNRTAPEP